MSKTNCLFRFIQNKMKMQIGKKLEGIIGQKVSLKL